MSDCFEVSATTKKLALISEVTGDAYHFIKLRSLVEAWQTEADNGSANAAAMINAIDLFHRLCAHVKDNP